MKHLGMAFILCAIAACSSDNASKDAGNGGGGAHKGAGSGGRGVTGGGAVDDDAGGQPDAGVYAGRDADIHAAATHCKAPATAASSGNACPSGDPVALKATLVKDGFTVPLFVTHAPYDTARLFVVERGGRISILDATSGAALGDFLNVQDVATSSSSGEERGLLGLAFHPDYPHDPRFFVNYTTTPPVGSLKTVIASYEVSSDPNVADAASEQVLFDFDQPQSNHNGGMLAFANDGCLFAGTGDGGNSNDTGTGHAAGGNGQSLSTPLGKILRLDVDAPITGAPGNLAGAAVAQIWDYGIRNAWRFSFDRMTGDLYIGDVGQDQHEEVDVEPIGKGHQNYGWPIAEGNNCGPNNAGCAAGSLVGLTPPVDEYVHVKNDDNCVIGGYVYRGTKIPSLQGWYLFGDNGSNKIRAFVWDGHGRCNDKTLVLNTRDNITLDGNITSFGEGGDGELYVVTSTSVYRIEAK